MILNSRNILENRVLNLPLQDEDIKDLRIGDIISLSGTLVTGRDEVHHRITEGKMDSPVDLEGMAIYHAGPIVKERQGNYEIVSIGPTSSVRMEKWAADFIAKTKVKVMIGKGGMGEKTANACREYRTIHCIYPGGCAVLGASQIKNIESVFWPELGMAECLWVMKTDLFGPLIVSIDTDGNNLFSSNSAFFSAKKNQLLTIL